MLRIYMFIPYRRARMIWQRSRTYNYMIKFMCCGKASRCNLFLAPRLFLIWGWVVSLVQGQLIIILAHTTCYLICISNSPQGYESDWLRCQLDFLYMSPSVKRLREDDDNAASEKRLSYYIHFDASSFMSAGQYDDFLLPCRNSSYYSLQEVG